jgi:putative PEP-CTERM system histidine kinase
MIAFGASSYAVLGMMYFVLTVMLLTSWRGPRIGGYLIGACLINAVWAGVLSAQIARGAPDPTFLFFVEVIRAGAWLTFLTQAGLGRKVSLLAHLAWIGVLVAGIWVWARQTYFGMSASIDVVMIPGGLVIALVGLIVVEQLYRNAPPAYRGSIKALVLGLGGMYSYDLFLYSQGVLFNVIDTATWFARGAVNILFVPLIVVAARRNPAWDVNIFVSRHVVFYSTTLVAVGLYLVLMSLGGYLLLAYGGIWGGVARVVFFAGAVLVLLTLLFSNTLRARLRVFLSKHFFHNKYDYREEWLRLVATLAKFENSSTRQVVIQAMAQIVESPAGILWMREDNGDSFALAAAYESDSSVPDITAQDPIVQFIRKDGWLIDLAEYDRIPDHYDNLELPRWLREIENAWLIVPLMSSRELLGLVLLFKDPGTPALNYEDRDLLKTVGNHIAVHLAQEKSDNLLSQAQQFEAYNRLTAFLMHDLNNLIAQQSLIVENAEKHKTNPEFVDDALETISRSVVRMRRVTEHLRQTSVVQPAEKVELGKLVMQVVSHCEDREPTPRAIVGDEQVWIKADRDRLFMSLSHAVRNAQDATPADGSVTVKLERVDGSVRIEIQDTGCGMDEIFLRERLFKPFDSTKGAQGVGIGAYQIQETIRAAGGDVTVESAPKQGTKLIITLKLIA